MPAAAVMTSCNRGSICLRRTEESPSSPVTSVNTPLPRLQSSEGKFTMSREIEPVRRSFCRHGSCTFKEVARLMLSGKMCLPLRQTRGHLLRLPSTAKDNSRGSSLSQAQTRRIDRRFGPDREPATRPPGGFAGAQERFTSKVEECPPGVPAGTNTKCTSPL